MSIRPGEAPEGGQIGGRDRLRVPQQLAAVVHGGNSQAGSERVPLGQQVCQQGGRSAGDHDDQRQEVWS